MSIAIGNNGGNVEYYSSPDNPGFYRLELELPEHFDPRRDQLPLRDWLHTTVSDLKWDGQIFESQPMRTYLDVPTESLTEVLNILEQQLGARLSQLNRSPFDGAQEADSYYTIDGEQGGADGWTAITVYSMENPSMEFLQQKGLELRMDPCFTKSIPRQLTVHVNAQQRLENGGNALDRVRELLMMNGFAERE